MRNLKDRELVIASWDQSKELVFSDEEETIHHAIKRHARDLGLIGKEFALEGLSDVVVFNNRTVKESIAVMKRTRGNLYDLARLFTSLEDIVQHSILIQKEAYRHVDRNITNHIDAMYQYVSAFHNNESVFPVKITVEKRKDNNDSTLYMTITVGHFLLKELAQDIKKKALCAEVHPDTKTGEGPANGEAFFTINIAQFIKYFNQEETTLIKSFPDYILNQSQLDIKRQIERNDKIKDLESAKRRESIHPLEMEELQEIDCELELD